MNYYKSQGNMAQRSQRTGGLAWASGLRAALGRFGQRLAPKHLRESLRRYCLAHQRQSIEGLEKLAQQPISNLFIALVLGVTLALPAGAVMVFAKAWHAAQLFQPEPRAMVYFQPEVGLGEVTARVESWSAMPGVLSTRVIDRDTGLQTYMSVSGIDPGLVMSLGENPLPHAVRVVLKDWTQSAAQTVQTQLSAEPGVDWVQLDLVWLQRFESLLSLSKHFLWLFVWSLGAVVTLIVANTVRLAIEHRRQDIVVCKLVGATNGFVRRPFLYLGFTLGFLGGVCALLLLKLAGIYLAAPFQSLLSAYSLENQVFPWRVQLSSGVLAGAAALGWLGAWFAARRHLVAIEPD
jgi:cell division transport system permease protein